MLSSSSVITPGLQILYLETFRCSSKRLHEFEQKFEPNLLIWARFLHFQPFCRLFQVMGPEYWNDASVQTLGTDHSWVNKEYCPAAPDLMCSYRNGEEEMQNTLINKIKLMTNKHVKFLSGPNMIYWGSRSFNIVLRTFIQKKKDYLD